MWIGVAWLKMQASCKLVDNFPNCNQFFKEIYVPVKHLFSLIQAMSWLNQTVYKPQYSAACLFN